MDFLRSASSVKRLVTANHEGGGDLFKGGIAGAFADGIDGALDLAGSTFDARQGVGYGHAEIVVAVGGEDYVVDSRDAGFDQAEDCGVPPLRSALSATASPALQG
jgi:hypothetical protein